MKTLFRYGIMKRVCKFIWSILRGVTLKKIRVVYIYFLALFLICLGYFIDSPIKELKIYEKATQYFGITLLPALLFLIFYGLLFLCKNNVKRLVFEIKLYFLLIVIILALYTYIIYKSGLDLTNIKNIVLDDEYYKSLIEQCLYRFKIGYVPTYALWLILNLKFAFQDIFFAIIITQIILIFLVIYAPIKNYIKNKYRAYKERKKLEHEEKLLYEQIKIKESLEKNETIKRVKFRENKEKLLEEKVEVFRKNIQLQKMVNLEEQTGEDK